MKSTKKALVLSLISLVVCASLLVGTTFAWFTDEVQSGTNQIVAGNLDVDVLTADGKSIEKSETLFNDVKLLLHFVSSIACYFHHCYICGRKCELTNFYTI